jgi:hypothetical protein
MKNTLAENMLRFGSKNLTQENRKNLRRLTEGTYSPAMLKAMPDLPQADAFFSKAFNEKNPGTNLVYNGNYHIYKVYASRTPQQIAANDPFQISAFGLVYKPVGTVGASKGTMNVIYFANAQEAISLDCGSMGLIDHKASSASFLSNSQRGDAGSKYGLPSPGAGRDLATLNNSFAAAAGMTANLATLPVSKGYGPSIKSNPLYAELYPLLTGDAKAFYDALPGQALSTGQKTPVKKP